MKRALSLAVALGGLVVLAGLVAPMVVGRMAAGRIRHEAAARGMNAAWSRLRVGWDARLSLDRLRLTRGTSGDTVFVADSVAVRLDPVALLVLRPQVSAIAVSGAIVRLSRSAAADLDTLPPPDEGRDRRADPAKAGRIRRSVESMVRLLFTPTRRFPALALRDVTVQAPAGAEAFWSGIRLAWLDSRPESGGMRMAAVGALLGENELPFEVSLLHAADDRIRGGLKVNFPPEGGAGPSEILVQLDGALHQDRRLGVITVHDSTHLVLGRVPIRFGAVISRRGPTFHLRLAADDLTQGRIRASLPAAVLGPLLDVSVEGSWDYRLGLDLDLAQPDSVEFAADVIPHDMALDPERTRLRLLGLEGPFLANIHLPRGRMAVRELSESNPFYRPLDAIAPALVSAVLTNEDGGFFRHRGFNTDAMKAAIAENLKAGAFRRGAGTITMQLARNLYLGHDRTLSRKFREVVLAWILEHLTGLSKQRLLEIYLNIIEWGPDVHGAAEAAHWYFDRDPADLTVDEALFLTTLIPSPSRWRSRLDASGALRPWERAQMHFIGRAMVAKGWLSPDALPPTDMLWVELRGPARDAFFPMEAGAGSDSVVAGPPEPRSGVDRPRSES